MEVARGTHVIKIEILKAQLGDGSGIGQNVAMRFVRQNKSYTRFRAARDTRKIHASFSQALHGQDPERIVTGLGDESHAAAEGREIVRQDSRRTAKRDGEVRRSQ